ncbi:hypothetical protein SAMN04488168_12334 [Bacillus sp. 491mf]|uniref:hypothetical protein n=1 Tax=Bacillus sp. 491mf TaxID=1761755 RepID=UPI0008E1071D|nr:hypothetical protein [Bacillus sp. 491mf]SFD18357.1 hypothetical protein SAMN04488168_12334 [Bacillus sp. 491mf]
MYINRHDCWEAVWKEKVTVDGELDIEQIKQELFEYQTILEQFHKNNSSYKLSKSFSKNVHRIVNKTVQRRKEKSAEQDYVHC